jgi:hypothetical protein
MASKIHTLPTQGRLRELFDYDPMTGIVTWRVSTSNRVKVGMRAGTPSGNRLLVSCDGIQCKLHRVIWKWMTGDEPPEQIDHEDTDGHNNRWENLRAANNSLNSANRRVQSNNRSGLKGAYYHPSSGLWQSRIQRDGVDYPLGYFATKELAHAAYARKAAELFGEFARAA